MKKIILMLAALAVMTGAANAKWWIFGKSADEVGLKYLYINKISVEETGPKIKIFREMLPSDGLVRISGKAYTGRGGVGSIRISLDDKATWSEVKAADTGVFEHTFKPEAAKTYALLLEITDTAGKMNKVEDTRKEISLSSENIQAKVRETFDAMFEAYNKENLQKFMTYVGTDFAADRDILERAVKRDFDALSSINLRYTLNNVAAGAQGRVFVSITYNRMVLVNKSGQTSSDTGSTEFVLGANEGKLSLYSMKQPLMFGLSDTENVATGYTTGNTGTALVLDQDGTLGGSGRQVTINCPASSFPNYTFATGVQGCGAGSSDIWFYDTSMPNLIGYSANEKTFNKTLAQLTSTEVNNASLYTPTGTVADSGPGYSYCFNISGEFYCVEMVSPRPAPAAETVSFKVKQF